MTKTQFIDVPAYGDEFAKMQLFAKSFNHEINPTRCTKVFAFQRGDVTFGYADVVYLPVAFPAFHPELTTPRGIVEVLDGWRHQCEINTSGEGLIGVPTPELRKTFPEGQIVKAGFKPMQRELYYLDMKE